MHNPAESADDGLYVLPIPAFTDNYLWLIHDGRDAVVVDPGDAAPVEAVLRHSGLSLRAILVTHSHADHVGGIEALLADRPHLPVYGPARETVPARTHAVGESDRVQLRRPLLALEVIEVPGHTVGHVAYYGQNRLFCGDTLFACGCGRIDQPAAVMHRSLQRLAALPPATLVYCTHEYTLANIRFALTVDGDNAALRQRATEVAAQRTAGLVTLPSTIALERATNPFLRCHETALADAAARARPAADAAHRAETGAGAVRVSAPPDAATIFGCLRAMKDAFR